MEGHRLVSLWWVIMIVLGFDVLCKPAEKTEDLRQQSSDLSADILKDKLPDMWRNQAFHIGQLTSKRNW